MKALTIHQPWASLIVHGFKDVENRRWRTNYRGEFLIHAGLTYDPAANEFLRVRFPEILPRPDPALLFGGIIGTATLSDCIAESASPWFCGPFGFVIERPHALPFRPCRGALGFFDPEYDVPARAPAASTRQRVYVDDVFTAVPMDPAARKVGTRWCHLYTTPGNEPALHALARRIGMARAWFQDKRGFPHYDLTPKRRERALRAGAIPRPLITHLRQQRLQEKAP